ncbi:hypothetical protein [Streptomyces sp. NPDC001070]
MLPTVAPKCRPGAFGDKDRWFVGLRFSGAAGCAGRHYYVVGEAADAESAVAVALARAADSVECRARGDAEIDGVEVRRLLWNPWGGRTSRAPYATPRRTGGIDSRRVSGHAETVVSGLTGTW